MNKSYSELIKIPTFKERFEYLSLRWHVAEETFGYDRIFNQKFYRSSEWKQIRDHVIVRDSGRDLGIKGREIVGKIIIHHINPISLNDIRYSSESLLDPENLICTCDITHNAIHYGDASLLLSEPIERKPNDTCPWRH